MAETETETETETGGAAPWLTPVRMLVKDPDGDIWWLGADGRVARSVDLDEIGSWAPYSLIQPTVVNGVLTYTPMKGASWPAWEMHNRTWEQMAKLAACTCPNKNGPHWVACCLVAVMAETGPDIPF